MSPADAGSQAVLLATPSWREQQTLARVLRTVASQVDVAASMDEALARATGAPYALFLADLDLVLDKGAAYLDRIAALGPATLLLGSPNDYARLGSLLEADRVSFFISRNAVLAEEVVVTTSKLLSQDLFGVEKYLTWGARTRHATLRDTGDRAHMVDEIMAYATGLGVDSRVVTMIRTVTDELIMNAIFNAPVDQRGEHTWSELDRTEDRPLEGRHAVDVRYACDGSLLAVSVEDHFGSLERATIAEYLGRCFQGGENRLESQGAGAGLGIYMAFERVRQLVFNIAPGVRTEAIGVVELDEQAFRSRERPRSFQVFRLRG